MPPRFGGAQRLHHAIFHRRRYDRSQRSAVHAKVQLSTSKVLEILEVLDDFLNVLGGFDASLESLGVYIVHSVGSNE